MQIFMDSVLDTSITSSGLSAALNHECFSIAKTIVSHLCMTL